MKLELLDTFVKARCVWLLGWLELGRASTSARAVCLGLCSFWNLDVPTPSQSGLQALESHFCEEHSDLLPLRIH